MAPNLDSPVDPFTMELCRTDARANIIRQVLIHYEHEAHQSGWDGKWAGPVLYTAFTHSGSDGDGPSALALAISTFADVVSETMSTTGDLSATLAAATIAHERLRRNGAASATEDLFHGPLDMAFAGYALGWELWEVEAPIAEAPALLARARSKLLRTDPNRREVRAMTYYDRRGVLWTIKRVRGSEPIITARQADHPELEVGGVPHALSRMVNAVAWEPVPIIPLAGVDGPASGARGC